MANTKSLCIYLASWDGIFVGVAGLALPPGVPDECVSLEG